MRGALGWLGTLWSLSVIDKDGEDVKRLRELRLGDRVIKRVNKFVANAFLGFLTQCALCTLLQSTLVSLEIGYALCSNKSLQTDCTKFAHSFQFINSLSATKSNLVSQEPSKCLFILFMRYMRLF